MNDLAELKNYVIAHARSQNLSPEYCAQVLGRIRTDGEGEPGSWTAEWVSEGSALEDQGLLLEACQRYNLARFPFADGPARSEALSRCVTVFDRWRQTVAGIEPLDVPLPGGTVRCWTSGLSGPERKPLLVIIGGIVSIKEQWAPVLLSLAPLGIAGLVTEMPGVGENPLPYDRESWRMLPGLLDAVAGRADVRHSYLLALSFSGHLALRAALADDRIAGIVGAGTPVRDFFTDPDWQRQVPRITVDTLAHLTAVKPAEVFDVIRDWALTDDDLSALDIPVGHVTSKRDEIIPPADSARLTRLVRQARAIEHDDVHGSPDHFAQTRAWCMQALLDMIGGPA